MSRLRPVGAGLGLAILLLGGTGARADSAWSVTPTTLSFGSVVAQPTGWTVAPPTLKFTITNPDPTKYVLVQITKSPASGTPFALTGTNGAVGDAGPCGMTYPGTSCDETVSFQPTAVGHYSATFAVQGYVQAGATTTQSVTVTGDGIAAGAPKGATKPNSSAIDQLKRDLKLEDEAAVEIGKPGFGVAQGRLVTVWNDLEELNTRFPRGSAARDDLDSALAGDLSAYQTISLGGDSSAGQKAQDKLAAARVLKTKVLSLLTSGAAQPAAEGSERTITEKIDVPLLTPTADPAGEVIAVRVLLPYRAIPSKPVKVESVVADLGTTVKGLISVYTLPGPGGTTTLNLEGVLDLPRSEPRPDAIVINLKLQTAEMPRSGPVTVKELAPLTANEKLSKLCGSLLLPAGGKVVLGTRLNGKRLMPEAKAAFEKYLAAECKREFAP